MNENKNKYYTQDEVNELMLEFIAAMCEKEKYGENGYMIENIETRARRLNTRVRMSKYEQEIEGKRNKGE